MFAKLILGEKGKAQLLTATVSSEPRGKSAAVREQQGLNCCIISVPRTGFRGRIKTAGIKFAE